MSSWIAWHRKGMDHRRGFEIKEAKYAFDMSLQLSMADEDHIGIASNYIELGRLYLGAHEFQTAEDYLKKALKIAELRRNPRLAAACLQVMSDVDFRQGKAEEAIAKCERGKKLIAKDASPDDLKSFDTRIDMLTSKTDVTMFVADWNMYREAVGLSGTPSTEPSQLPSKAPERALPQDAFPLDVSLDDFPPPARFPDVLDAIVETWELADGELSEKYGRDWCVPPDFDNAVNADGPHNYVVAQLKKTEKSGNIMIGEGKASLLLLVRHDITQTDEGEEQVRVTECIRKHWAEVVGIPYKPAELARLTLRRRDDGSMEVVKPGIENLWLTLPIPGPPRIQFAIPAIVDGLQSAHAEISQFSGAAWCANWVHVLPPVLTGEAIAHISSGRQPACILYPEEGYADLKLEVLEKVGDLRTLKACIEEHWPFPAVLGPSGKLGRPEMLVPIVGCTLTLGVAAVAIIGIVTLARWVVAIF